MAKYEITYTCGHTGIRDIVGTNSHGERDRTKAYYESTSCPDCYAIEQAAETAEAKEAMSHEGFVELAGSDKQVAWAEKIRASMVREFLLKHEDRAIRMRLNFELGIGSPEEIEKSKAALLQYDTMIDIMKSQKSASWWIDIRDDFLEFVIKTKKEAKMRIAATKRAEADANDDAVSAIAEATVTPAEATKPGAVEISVSDNVIRAKYQKDEDFRLLVKGLGYEWNKGAFAWEMKIGTQTGTAQDRAAELGNDLLRDGYAIILYDPETRRKAIAGEYEKRCWNWIVTLVDDAYSNMVAIKFPKNDDLYKQARKIHGARWNNPYIMVPLTSYELVLDFAHINDFRISDAAAARMNAYKNSLRPPVIPASPREDKPVDKLAEILNSDDAILEDLKDDDTN